MKSKDFYAFLVAAQNFKGGEQGRYLGHLAQIFAVLPDKTVAEVVKRLRDLRPAVAPLPSPRLGAVQEPVGLLRQLMASRAKEALVKDVRLLEDLIEHHASVTLHAFVATATEALRSGPIRATKAIRADLVERYNRRLEEALGDDRGFQSVFSELMEDSEISGAEVAALAKRFAHAAARSKDAALKKIFARHQALITSRAKSLATAGRVAG